MNEQKMPDAEKTPGTLQIVSSVFAAAFGVQSSKNQERDFKHGKARVFIIAGTHIYAVVYCDSFYDCAGGAGANRELTGDTANESA